MKKFHYIFIIALLLLTNSCERDLTSEGVSTMTTYVTLDLTGGPTVTFPAGNAYVDPGFKGTEGTQDVTSTVTVTGEVDGNTVGLYTLQYSAVNVDGYSSSVERTVIIYDPAAPATDLSGNYSSNVHRVTPAETHTDLQISIEMLAPGFFFVSDFIGGFYEQGRDYGSGYAVYGYFQLNSDNSISVVSSQTDGGFGGTLDDLTNGKNDPATQTLTWDAFYLSYDFSVTLVKVQN